ncbi:MAG TPA: diaminopimelate epimerase [Gemmatimonadales bacterium]|nr:diaminopimelate epimerase [Gemmatimonadales bacterium]
MTTAFYKMSGSGNDFVFLDGRTNPVGEWPAERIRAACDRREGVGGDGLVVLEPASPGAVRMHYFNADGGRAEMCGNAALCSTRLAARLQLFPGPDLDLLTDSGPMRTRCAGPGDLAELNLGTMTIPADVASVELEPGESRMALGTVGVPHLVVLVDDIEAVNVRVRGRALRHHTAFQPKGANANFVAPPPSREHRWRIRTFERGVEDETLACGTGTVAAALALAGWGLSPLPTEFVSRGGAPLAVSAAIEGNLSSDTWLCGQGRLVFEGTYSG